jgi:protein involved in polysaccharide export with SLBB domain
MSPQGVYLRPQMTITRAIAMVGGVKKEAKQNDIRIYRQKPGAPKPEEIHVDLAAIKKRKAEDVLLQPYDIIEVPDTHPLSLSRLPETLINSFTGAMTSTISAVPLRVIY